MKAAKRSMSILIVYERNHVDVEACMHIGPKVVDMDIGCIACCLYIHQ